MQQSTQAAVLFLVSTFVSIAELAIAFRYGYDSCIRPYPDIPFSYATWLTVSGIVGLVALFLYLFWDSNEVVVPRLVWYIVGAIILFFAWYIVGAILFFRSVSPHCPSGHPLYDFGLTFFILQTIGIVFSPSLVWLSGSQQEYGPDVLVSPIFASHFSVSIMLSQANGGRVMRAMKNTVLLAGALLLVAAVSSLYVAELIIAKQYGHDTCIGTYQGISFSYATWLTVSGIVGLVELTIISFGLIVVFLFPELQEATVVCFTRFLVPLHVFHFAWYIVGAVLFFRSVSPHCPAGHPLYDFGLTLFILETIGISCLCCARLGSRLSE